MDRTGRWHGSGGRRGWSRRGLALPILAAALAPAQGPAGPTSRPGGEFRLVDQVEAIVNDRVITFREVEALLPKADPELRANPSRLQEERARILRELATYLILEQGIYTLQHEPDQIDQVLESLVQREQSDREREAGGAQAYLDRLKTLGRTFEENRTEIRSRLRWQLFLEERLYQRFTGRKALLRVRPAQMLEVYGSPAFASRRELPAWVRLQVFQLPPGPDAEARAEALAGRLAAAEADPELRTGESRTRIIALDCPETALGLALQGLGLAGEAADHLILARAGLDPELASLAFGPGQAPRMERLPGAGTGVRLIQIQRREQPRTVPFTEPEVQEELRQLVLTAERRAAEESLVRELWSKARIYPAWLQALGPFGFRRGDGP